MKRFTEVQKKSKIRKINEAEANLPQNLKDLSKDDLIKIMSGMTVQKTEKDEEKSGEVVQPKSDISKFFSKLFESREMAHIYHLTVKGEPGSHAAHKALQEYYEGILEFIDEIIEVYQGQYGLVENYEVIDTADTKTKDKLEYFKELVEWIKTEKKCIKQEDTHLINIVDEMVALMYKTIYKLTYNK